MAYQEEVRAYTMKEVRGEFLTNLYVTQSVLDKREKRDGLDIAYVVLNTIDQGEPLFEIIPSTTDKDIAGILHSLILESDEQLRDREMNDKKLELEVSFAKEVRRLAKEYDSRGINNSHVLTTAILRLIDQGINGMTFALKALGNPEDIEYYKSMETNYYPEEGENIAGKLSYEYNRIVDACNTRKNELDTMFLVPAVEINPPRFIK